MCLLITFRQNRRDMTAIGATFPTSTLWHQEDVAWISRRLVLDQLAPLNMFIRGSCLLDR